MKTRLLQLDSISCKLFIGIVILSLRSLQVYNLTNSKLAGKD